MEVDDEEEDFVQMKKRAKIIDEDEPCGTKDVPDDIFEGLTIVVTGVFEIISRDDLVAFIKEKGGKNTSAVSGRTDYLIAGHKLEDGRDATSSGKYRGA